jgi:hypothetical protein
MSIPEYQEPLYKYRALLSDGRVFEFLARHDNSDVRDWILKQNGITINKSGASKGDEVRIAGVAKVKDEEN